MFSKLRNLVNFNDTRMSTALSLRLMGVNCVCAYWCRRFYQSLQFSISNKTAIPPFPLLFLTRQKAFKLEKHHGKRKPIPCQRLPYWENHQGRIDAARPQHHLVGLAGGLLAREFIQGVSPQMDLYRPALPDLRSLGLRLLPSVFGALPSQKT